jgi:hypothetical protein
VRQADLIRLLGLSDAEIRLNGAVVKMDSAEPVVVVPIEQFAADHEAGAEALLGDGEDDAVLPTGGDSMIYGDGGAGKTTLGVDLAMHLASGRSFLGITVKRPVNVLLLEYEGPRPLYRRKLERKLASWSG